MGEILGDKKVACEKLNNEGVVRCYCTEDECNSKEMVNNWIHENAEVKSILLLSGSDESSVTTLSTVIQIAPKEEQCSKHGAKYFEGHEYGLNEGAVGGLLDGKEAIICGGKLFLNNEENQACDDKSRCSSDLCYKYNKTLAGHELVKMNYRRSYPASVVYKNKLWITGGFDFHDQTRHQETEFILANGEKLSGPNLPVALEGHAMVRINSTNTLIIGGLDFDLEMTSKTWYFNHETEVFTSGPNMNIGRYKHGAGHIQDSVTKEDIVLVVGGEDNDFNNLDSTEILKNDNWEEGPAFPKKISNPAVIEYSKEELIIMGGWDDNFDSQKEIYKFACENGNCKLVKLQQELQEYRADFVAIPLTDEIFYCVAGDEDVVYYDYY